MPGATNASLYLQSAIIADSGGYFVTAARGAVSTTSMLAQVVVAAGPIGGWVVRQGIADYSLSSVAFGQGTFVAVGYAYLQSGYRGVIVTSPDGKVWTQRLNQAGFYFRDVAFSGDTFVAVSGIESIYCRCPGIFTSTNGLDWTQRTSGSAYPLYETVGANGLLIAAGGDYRGFSFGGYVFTSRNSVDWTASYLGETPWFRGAAYGAGHFVLSGTPLQGDNRVLVSADGRNWSSPSLPVFDGPGRLVDDIVFGRNEFVLLGQYFLNPPEFMTDILTSANGTNWTRTAVVSNQLDCVAFGDDVYMGAGASAIYSSPDAIHWKRELASQSLLLEGIAHGAGTFVAVGGGGRILQTVGPAGPRLTVLSDGPGSVAQTPERNTYEVGDRVVLTAIPARWHKLIQWNDGVTNDSRVVTVSANNLENIFTARFAPITALEEITIGPVSRTAPIGMPVVLVDDQFVVSGTVIRTNHARLSFTTTFPNGRILYTLDGSAPSVGSRIYLAPVDLKRRAVVRALAYNHDFTRSIEADPVEVIVESETVPFSLSATTQGGGVISMNPPGPSHESNASVTVTATPAVGWSFLHWLEDAAGTNPVITIPMTRDRCVEAVFGTHLNTIVTGGGIVLRTPAADLYPYGAKVKLLGQPAAGASFALWGDDAASNTNPLEFFVRKANQTVSAFFVGLAPDQYALMAGAQGGGSVGANPRANVFNRGHPVILTATPDAGQDFLGWLGDTNATDNPLRLSMNRSWSVTANFTARPRLTLEACPASQEGGLLRLRLAGEYGSRYEVQLSLDLRSWSTLGAITNRFGTTVINVPSDGIGFVRARLIP